MKRHDAVRSPVSPDTDVQDVVLEFTRDPFEPRPVPVPEWCRFVIRDREKFVNTALCLQTGSGSKCYWFLYAKKQPELASFLELTFSPGNPIPSMRREGWGAQEAVAPSHRRTLLGEPLGSPRGWAMPKKWGCMHHPRAGDPMSTMIRRADIGIGGSGSLDGWV